MGGMATGRARPNAVMGPKAPVGTADERELALRLAELTGPMMRAASPQGVLACIGDAFERMGRRFSAWELQGSVLRLAYENWTHPAEAEFMGSLDGSPLVHLDASPIPPFIFADRQFFFLHGHEVFREIVASFRDRSGRKLSDAAIEGLIEAGTPTHGIFGPVFANEAPWGLLAFDWPSEDPKTLDLFTLFASQVGAALAASLEKELRARSSRELEIIRSWAKIGAADPHDTQRRYAMLSSLFRLDGSASLGLDLQRFAGEALALLVDGLGLEGAWLFSLDRDALLLEAHWGRGALGSLAGPAQIPVDGDLPCALAMQSAETVTVSGDEIDLPADWVVAAVPLVAWGRSVGCLAVGRADRRAFDSSEEELLGMYAAHMAVAIQQVRLSQMERQRVRQLGLLSEIGRVASDGGLERGRLLSAFFHALRRTLGFDACLGFVLDEADPEGSQGLGSAHMGGDVFLCPEEVVRLARESALTLHRSPGESSRREETTWGGDPTQICSLILRTPTATQAVVSLIRRGHLVSDQELHTLEAASTSIGFALEHARHFDSTRKSLDELKLLLQVSQTITGRPDYGAILQTAAHIATRLVGASHAFVLLLEEDGSALRGAATSDPAWVRSFPQMRIPLEEDTLAPRAITTKGPVLVEDVASTPWVSQVRTRRFSEKSLLAVPMMLLGEPIGCVVVADRRGPRRWQPAEVEKISLIASQLAIADANARLHEDLRSSRKALAETQEELLQKERLAALGELSAVIAHEVRNPLGAVFNSLRTLRKLLAPTGDAATLLDVVQEEADRLDALVAGLLDFAKPTPLDLQWLEMGPLIEGIVEAFQREMGVTVHVTVAADLPRVLLDATLIRQALLNLLQNAAQAMPSGEPPSVEVVERSDGGVARVEIRISDRGPGIPAELHGKILSPFFTTKATGTGLGLALVQRIADAHRGSLSFESWPGVGTTFTLTLEAHP